MWFFTKKIKEIVEKKVKEDLAQYKLEIDQYNSKLQGLEKIYLKLKGKTFKAQGIEKIIFHKDYLYEDKMRLSDIAHVQLGLTTYRMGRLSYSITVSMEKRAVFKVKTNCAICLMGLKFVDGGGWGHYEICKGSETVREYSKSKLVQEEGIILGSLIYYPDEILILKQVSGEGEIQVDLLGIKVTPVDFMTPLISVE